MTSSHPRLPSVDALLRLPELAEALIVHGHIATVTALRSVLDDCRARAETPLPAPGELAARAVSRLADLSRSRLRRVFNLTGTVLHTNLGRARALRA